SGRRSRPRGRRPDSCRRATWLEHLADDFAADIGGTRLGVGHDAARRGQDRDAESVEVARQLADLRIDAAARSGDALDLLDDRTAVVVLQLDAKLLHAGPQFLFEPAADVALALENIEHVGAQARSRSGHAFEACGLA